MKSLLSFSCFASMLACGANAATQSPDTKPLPSDPKSQSPATPRIEADLQSLQLLCNATVYHLQPLGANIGESANASGTAAAQPFVRVRDASFERDGRLRMLLVEPDSAPAGEPVARRQLPAKNLRWDETTKRWFTTDANLKFAELQEEPKAGPLQAASTADPALLRTKDPDHHPLLASALMQATAGGLATSGTPEGTVEATSPKTAPPAAVTWFHPTEQRLAFVVIPDGSRYLPLPWPLVRVMDRSTELQLLIDASPARVENGPTAKNALEQPTAALRQRCYAHYGLPVPKWDRAEPDAAGAKAGKAPAKAGKTADGR